MITALLLPIVIAGQTGDAALVSTMFSKYHAAKAVTGTISMNQTAFELIPNGQGFTEKPSRAVFKAHTTVQIDKAKRRLYLLQEVGSANESSRFLITADGKVASYNEPSNVIGRNRNLRLAEKMELDGKTMTESDVYHICAGRLTDRSVPLDIAFSSIEDLRSIRGSIINTAKGRKDKIGDLEVTVVGGGWSDIPGSKFATGRYEFWLTSDGSLKRFVREDIIAVKGKIGDVDVKEEQNVKVISVWDVDLKLDGPFNESLFKVVL